MQKERLRRGQLAGGQKANVNMEQDAGKVCWDLYSIFQRASKDEVAHNGAYKSRISSSHLLTEGSVPSHLGNES